MVKFFILTVLIVTTALVSGGSYGGGRKGGPIWKGDQSFGQHQGYYGTGGHGGSGFSPSYKGGSGMRMMHGPWCAPGYQGGSNSYAASHFTGQHAGTQYPGPMYDNSYQYQTSGQGDVYQGTYTPGNFQTGQYQMNQPVYDSSMGSTSGQGLYQTASFPPSSMGSTSGQVAYQSASFQPSSMTSSSNLQYAAAPSIQSSSSGVTYPNGGTPVWSSSEILANEGVMGSKVWQSPDARFLAGPRTAGTGDFYRGPAMQTW